MQVSRRKLAGIEYTIAEPADRQVAGTLIFLHGIGGDDSSFEFQSRALSDQFRVVAWNMPGYRQSAVLSPVTFEGLAESVLRLIDALDTEKVHIAGQSIGGMVAQEFYHRHPARVATLVLMATTAAFGGRDHRFRDAFLSARLEPLDNGVSMKDLARQSIPAVTGSLISAPALQGAVDAMAGLSESVYREVLKCLVTFNRRAELANISCPVCLIAGGEDKNAPAATMEKMAGRLSHAEYHELTGAGHLVNTELPDECNLIIRKFLHRNNTDVR